MINQVQKRILILALFAGELMMKSGAEIYRVEDTIVRICRACRIDYVECFATTTGLFLSLDSGSDESDMHTFIKRIHSSSIDLMRISRLNRFSRVFTSTDLSVEAGFEQLRAIAAAPIYALPWRVLGAVLVGAFMSTFYGAGLIGMLVAGIAAGLAYLFSRLIAKLNFADFIRIFISCAVACFTVLLLLSLSHTHNTTAAILGAVTVFMPGVAITNAARDLLSGDMLSGVSRGLEAIVSAVGIAGATASSMALWARGGGFIGDKMTAHPLPAFILYGLFITLGFCLLFHAPIRQMAAISVIGAAGMLVLDWIPMLGGGQVAAVFLGTCVVGILAECASRAGKDATTVFILPGIIPFVPGATIYESMAELIDSGVYTAAVKGVETLITAGSIAVALILIASLTRLSAATVDRVKMGMQSRAERRARKEATKVEETEDQ
jgi:uncharacterized membrane protein YjjP (DUF1212 family)